MTLHTKPCTMVEVRLRVNALDDVIVPLLVERSRCMHDAARIKQYAHEVRDEQRIQAVVDRVRALAAQHDGNADLMEGLYRQMMEQFIVYEARLFAAKKHDTESPAQVTP